MKPRGAVGVLTGVLCVGLGLSILVGCPPPPTEPTYSILTIDTREGQAYGVNGHYEVVGRMLFMDNWHAFLWRPDQQPGTIDLGTLGGASSSAYDINDYSEVVGSSDVDFLWHAFRWTQETYLQDLGTLGGGASTAWAINNAGTIVGSAGDVDGFWRAFIWWPDHGMEQIAQAEQGTHAFDVNNWDASAGSLRDRTSLGSPYPPEVRAWSANGVALPIANTLGGSASMASGINDNFEVVGFAEDGQSYLRAFRWTEAGGMESIGSLGYCRADNLCSAAYDINFNGEIVGAAIASNASLHATLWKQGVVYDLNDLIPDGTEWMRLEEANAINVHGAIVGVGSRQTYAGVLTSPFLMLPLLLESFTISPDTVVGGISVQGIVRLSDEAPFTVRVDIDISGVADFVGPVVGQATIPEGEREDTFNIPTETVREPRSGDVAVEFGGTRLTAQLEVTPN